MAFEDQRRARVAAGGDQDGADAEQFAAVAGDVDADQRRDPGEADEQADEAPAGDAFGRFEAERQQRR